MRAQARLADSQRRAQCDHRRLRRRLLSCVDDEQIGEVGCGELARLFDCNAVLLSPSDRRPKRHRQRAARCPPRRRAIWRGGAWSFEQGEPVGRGSPRLNPGRLAVLSGQIGRRVCWPRWAWRATTAAAPIADEQLPLLDNLLDQTALALERARLEREMQESRGLRERDRLRGALLSSVGQICARR